MLASVRRHSYIFFFSRQTQSHSHVYCDSHIFCLISCCIADLCAKVGMDSTNNLTNTEIFLTIWSPSMSLTGVQTVTVMSGCLVEGGGVESSPDIKVTIHHQPFLFSCSQRSTLKSSFNSTCITTSREVVIRAEIRVFLRPPHK